MTRQDFKPQRKRFLIERNEMKQHTHYNGHVSAANREHGTIFAWECPVQKTQQYRQKGKGLLPSAQYKIINTYCGTPHLGKP